MQSGQGPGVESPDPAAGAGRLTKASARPQDAGRRRSWVITRSRRQLNARRTPLPPASGVPDGTRHASASNITPAKASGDALLVLRASGTQGVASPAASLMPRRRRRGRPRQVQGARNHQFLGCIDAERALWAPTTGQELPRTSPPSHRARAAGARRETGAVVHSGTSRVVCCVPL